MENPLIVRVPTIPIFYAYAEQQSRVPSGLGFGTHIGERGQYYGESDGD